VTELGWKGWPARGFDDGRPRWPRRLGGTARTARDLNHKRTGEVYWGLMKLLERLAGGERERAHELEVAAAMAAEGGSGWRAGGARRGLIRRSSTG
jgi:hypothetical protein